MQTKLIKKFLLFIIIFSLISMCFLPNVLAADDENFSIDSASGILMDLSSGKILYEKNMDEKRYPASLTKVLTAIVVLENCKLDEIATVSYDSVMTLSSRICYSKFTSWGRINSRAITICSYGWFFK